MISICDCNLTGGCPKCRESFIGCIQDDEAERMERKIREFKRLFNEDLDRRFKEFFNIKG